MTDHDLPPSLEAVVDSYRLRLVRDPHCPLDAFFPSSHETQNHLGTTIRTGDRGLLLRLLLQEERGASDRNRFDFKSYWSRPWFKEHVDDVVAVLLEDRFEVVRLLGAGGQGLVYLVKNLKVDGRLEALKVFHLKDHQQLTDAEFKEWQARFRRESAATHKLRENEHVPMVYEVNEIHGIYYFTMQYIDGETLKEHVERSREPISPRQAAAWMQTLAQALHTLHASGHIHRDIKPSNLMLDKKGFLYLLDFGLVKIKSEGQLELTHVGGFGTRGYLAPEQETDARGVTPKADIYSLGATFYFALTGRNWDEAKDKSPWPKSVPVPLREICLNCLDPDPEKRPTARDVDRRLSHWLHRLSRRQVFAAGAVALAGAAVAFWYKYRPVPIAGIVENAARLRQKYLDELFSEQRWENGVLLYGKRGHRSNPEVRTIAQSAYAVFTAVPKADETRAPVAGMDRLLANLSFPFDKKRTEVYWTVQRDASGRPLGWIASQKQDHPTADVPLWMAIACARAVRWCNDNASHAGHAARLKEHHRRLLEMLESYYWPASRGWNLYANQAEPLKHSSYAASLALRAQLEAHRAGLSWFAANTGSDRAETWLKQTTDFLLEAYARDDGWHCRLEGRADAADLELGLFIRAGILQAAAARSELMPKCDPFKSDCLALLAREEFTLVEALAGERSVTIEARIDARHFRGLDPQSAIASESLTVFFYPWSVAVASLLLRLAPALDLSFGERRQLHALLGDWAGPLGEHISRRDYTPKCETFGLAEAILGLSAVADLAPHGA
jgi:predicted Ser/Thr protein kinase